MRKIVETFEKFNATISGEEDPLLNAEGLSSLMTDRLRSELNKLGVQWDGQPVLLSQIESKEIGVNEEVPSVKRPTESNEQVPISIGTDIQCIDDFPISKDFWREQFYTDNFKDSEIAYASSKAHPIETFAGIFCAKEAVFKANNQISRAEIEISYKEGKPSYDNFSLSISHSKSYAVATALQLNITQRLLQVSKPSVENSTISRPDTEPVTIPLRQSSLRVFLIAIMGAILVNIIWQILENFM
ncbi:4'-phosphopantetheinyl transferase superfamily protein [Akkermansiaceae bacterium]|nr:4'-phosphopantetheinyl transferase superfamily protein [Akkermansiaceae bacterium]